MAINHSKNTNGFRKQLNSLFRSMNFISRSFLGEEKTDKKEIQIFFNIYQQLGLAWEFLGLHCKHQEGYKKITGKREACKICGKIKGTDEFYILLPQRGLKKHGRKLKPNSKKIFDTKKDAEIINDKIDFHGVLINVDVHNAYKSKILDHKINMAAERIVTIKERGIECNINEHIISVKLHSNGRKAGGQKYGGFPWEIKKKDLKNFPIIFEFDGKYKLSGVTILK